MRRTRANVALFILLAVSAAVAKDRPKAKQTPQTSPVLWSDPVDIASRNLFYGEGGERDQPHSREHAPSFETRAKSSRAKRCDSECPPQTPPHRRAENRQMEVEAKSV